MGCSGVPFMKMTSGSLCTAASILERASCDKSRTSSRFDCGGLARRKVLLLLLLRREWRWVSEKDDILAAAAQTGENHDSTTYGYGERGA